jgi:YD repeat-containing protein
MRTYNSHDPRDGLFGNGWTVDCESGLFLNETTEGYQYILRRSDGKRYVYRQAADGSYASPEGRYERIEPQSDGSVHLVSQFGGRRVFTASGKLTSKIDRNGNSINYTYDRDTNNLLRIGDGDGRHLRLEYNSTGRVSAVLDHTDRRWRYGYDLNGNLITVTDPMGGVRQFHYSPYQADGDGHIYQQLTQVTDESDVVVTTVEYDGEKVSSYTEQENQYSYSWSSTDPAYVTKTDRQNNGWTFYYDEEGLITREIDPLRNEIASEFDADGNLVRFTDTSENVWRNAYDAMGRLLTSTDPLGNVTTREYQGSSPNPVRVVSPSGRLTRLTYDVQRNLLTLTDAAGNRTNLEWDSEGNLTAYIDPLGNRIEQDYNTHGQLTSATDSLGRETEVAYDARGNLVSITNPAGETVRTEYDALGRITSSVDAAGHATTYEYDAAGRLLTLTDPRGNAWRFSYDEYGRLDSETAPDDDTTQYSYLNNNLLAQIIYPDESEVSYTYDAAGRVTRKTTSDDTVNYIYDALGRVVRARNGAAQVDLEYDAAGRQISETVDGRTVLSSYNEEGERTGVTLAERTLTYERDVRGLITQVNAQGNHRLNYDALGRLSRLSHPNGQSTDYTYDAASQLTGIEHDSLMALDYTHDQAGRISRKQGNGDDWRYEYDLAERLIQAAGASDTFTYEYDALGNRLESGGVYGPSNQIEEDENYTYRFDQRGNLTQKLDRSSGTRDLYIHNGQNRLISFERYTGGSDEASTVATYEYDPFGRRVSKTVGDETTHYQWDGSQLVAEYDAAGTVTKRYYYGTGHAPLQVEDGSGIYQIYTDHLETPWLLADQSGQVVWRANYTPYGMSRVDGDPDDDGGVEHHAFIVR